jgi:hypothetical protein
MAWVYTFDTATPVGTDNVSTLDDRARETKSALQERLNIDLYMPLTGTQVSDTSAGKHRKVQFYGVLAVKPTLLTGEAAIYIKTVTGKSELFFEDSDGTEKQLTSVGKLNIVAADISVDVIDDTKIELRNNQYLVASNVAGDADVSLIKANSSDVAQIPDGSQLATSAAPTADAQIANKKYVDDQIAAIRATDSRYRVRRPPDDGEYLAGPRPFGDRGSPLCDGLPGGDGGQWRDCLCREAQGLRQHISQPYGQHGTWWRCHLR